MYQRLTPSWWSLTFVEFNRLKPLKTFPLVSWEFPKENVSPLKLKGIQKLQWDDGRNRGREPMCWGWAILWMQEGLSRRCLISVGKLVPQSREQAVAVHTSTWTVSSSLNLSLRWNSQPETWGLVYGKPLMASHSMVQTLSHGINSKTPRMGDLFSLSLSKPALLGLLPYWNLKDTKQKKLSWKMVISSLSTHHVYTCVW